MLSWDNPDDRVAIAQMNAELQNAQLELLSAQCATQQLRLRFSADDLARFGHRDILRKSVQCATALSDYYTSIEKKFLEKQTPATTAAEPSNQPGEELILTAIERVSTYMRQQRERYFAQGTPLDKRQKAIMWPYFPAPVLESARIVALDGKSRIPNPPFFEEYKALGFLSLPEITHMHSVTFLDVVVFNEPVTERSLFHGLVHAVQFGILGLGGYSDLFVRALAANKLHFSVPLEAHAFALESKFAAIPTTQFSVEEHVRLWVKQKRY